jgi:hypothetical protein
MSQNNVKCRAVWRPDIAENGSDAGEGRPAFPPVGLALDDLDRLGLAAADLRRLGYEAAFARASAGRAMSRSQ